MPRADTIALFILAAMPLVLFPGPSVAFIVTSALRRGTRFGVIATAGVETGYLVHVAAACIGISAIVATSALAFSVQKLAGAGYLLWLALAALRSSRHPASQRSVTDVASAGVAPSGLRNPFQQGFLVGALNPKTAVFFLAFLPQFADPTRGPIPPQLILFGLVFIALACVPDFAWAIGAARMRGHLARVSRRLIDRLAAGVYAILALFVLALQRRAN